MTTSTDIYEKLRAKLDAVFFGDVSHANGAMRGDTMMNGFYEPMTVLSAIAARTSRLGLLGTIAIAMMLDGTRLPVQWLEYLGRLSMPIFLMHTLFSAATRAGLKLAGFADPIAVLALVTVAGLFLPLIAYRIAIALNITRLLGFGAPVAR